MMVLIHFGQKGNTTLLSKKIRLIKKKFYLFILGRCTLYQGKGYVFMLEYVRLVRNSNTSLCCKIYPWMIGVDTSFYVE